MQEHPGTGRRLDHERTNRVVFEEVVKAMGVPRVEVMDPTADTAAFEKLVVDSLSSGQLCVIIARRDCLLAVGKIRQYEKAAKEAGNE